jgi:hypothetical protein
MSTEQLVGSASTKVLLVTLLCDRRISGTAEAFGSTY